MQNVQSRTEPYLSQHSPRTFMWHPKSLSLQILASTSRLFARRCVLEHFHRDMHQSAKLFLKSFLDNDSVFLCSFYLKSRGCYQSWLTQVGVSGSEPEVEKLANKDQYAALGTSAEPLWSSVSPSVFLSSSLGRCTCERRVMFPHGVGTAAHAELSHRSHLHKHTGTSTMHPQ